MMPSINVPHPQSAAPIQSAAITAVVSEQGRAAGQTAKEMRESIDSAQHYNKAPRDKAQKESTGNARTVKSEAQLHAMRQDQQKVEQHSQQRQHYQNVQQEQTAIRNPGGPPSYGDKLAALSGGRFVKTDKVKTEKLSEHTEIVEPHLMRHRDGSITAGLGTARLISDLQSLVGADMFSGPAKQTAAEAVSQVYQMMSEVAGERETSETPTDFFS